MNARKFLPIPIICLIALSAAYGLGAFGDDSVVKVADKEYSSGGFSFTGTLLNVRLMTRG